jgi:zinc resistance-associated protein
MKPVLSKKSPLILMLLALLAMTVMATTASARQWGCDMMGGGPALTPEQAAQAFDLRQKFLQDTVDVRRQMAVKRAELRTLWQAEKPEDKQILAKQKELAALKAQLQEKAVAMKLEMRKFMPAGPGGRMGFGPMGPGCGPGMGAGCMGMGPGGGMGGAPGMMMSQCPMAEID